MFEWLRKRRGPAANRPEEAAAAAGVPEAARWYMDAIKPHMGQPFVRVHFHRVTWMAVAGPDEKPADFFALEFRAGDRAALIWCAGPDRWNVGQYIRLAHPGADMTTAPSGLTGAYFSECATCSSLAEAIAFLEVATPEPFRGVPPKTGAAT
ncbi:hypothetical protein OJF2_11010 [Aquisphaera giovannonii]|uniref:Uncharacterized protein n=1 Tax=Aquisphaera giovannonii TaxID=406548 RepID=A0A5B9VWL2_9BACT|nr:hypothetical protein [Aquisphaera giovannonii]QEH32622.1 hypothetical protein OJF2_11010 [Aquisphaera giovannonii]